MQFGMNQAVQFDERRTNTEPGAVATGSPVPEAHFGTWVLMQFDSNFMRLVTKSEPGAVATGQGLNKRQQYKVFEELEYSGRSLPLPVLILYWLARLIQIR
jgi:hypothetical protein